MEVFSFSEKTFDKIPKDNSTDFRYDKKSNRSTTGKECVIIFRGQFASGGFVVAHVSTSGKIERRGVLWELRDAETFANSIAT